MCAWNDTCNKFYNIAVDHAASYTSFNDINPTILSVKDRFF